MRLFSRMRPATLAISALLLVASAVLITSFSHPLSIRAASTGQHPTRTTGAAALHYAMTRGAYRASLATSSASTQSPLTYRGGPVMQSSSTTYAIFWEPPTLQDGTTAYVSPTYNSLIEQYLGDVGGSGLYNIATQYYQNTGGTNAHIVNNSTFGGAWVDTSPFPASGCNDSFTPGDCLSGGQIKAEILKAMATNGWSGGLNTLFLFYSPKGEGFCTSYCAFTNYCALHTSFTSGGMTIPFAIIPYEGTDLPNCGIPDSPNNDIDADSSINMSSHEQMESVTDPLLNAWLDSKGQEIGDKCGFQFGSINLDNSMANTEMNGHYYLVQQEYSNATGGCAIARSVSGDVYVGSDDHSLYNLNASDGSQAGTYATNDSVVSSPAVVNGTAYVGSNDGSVYAFSTSTGTLLWSFPTGGPVRSSPAVVNSVVYIGSSDGNVYALNATTGTKLWQFTTGGPVNSSPTVYNKVVYIGSNDHSLYALKIAHGTQLWNFATGGAIDSQPLIFKNTIFVGSNDGSLYAINLSGVQIASYTTGASISHSSPVALNTAIYFGSTDGNVYALSTSQLASHTLPLLWSYAIQSPILTTPSIAYKTVYIAASDGNLYALNANASPSQLLWKLSIGTNITSSPKVIDGIVYIGSDNDNLYALWADDGSLIWTSPTGGAVESSPSVVLTTY